ncbi:hypothetical protein PV04_04639 [Phialophora macrospora]|uniref:Peptidase A1 domain-containing protein n=1 Tax=Phialophora macrospora TaxID=1851006 RepID=A0A0D2FQ63_9EURO|nr:hypothetical protein PV04_04639 [Phialophora macrospora]
MATIRSLLLLPLFICFSVQLPLSNKPKNLQRRGYDVSQFSASLTRAGNIIDNEKLKYLFPIDIGGSTFNIEVDTGSSDTWIIQTGFECYESYVNAQGFVTSEPASECNFGPTYPPGDEFSPIEGIVQLSCYGESTENTLRCVEGPFGYAAVSVGGLDIPQQVIGAPNLSSFPAQGLAEQSGILGLGFPSLTSAYDTGTGDSVPYSSIVNTMFNVDTFDPPLAKAFSIALSRDASNNGNGGVLTFGGLPDLTDPTINASSTYTTAPWQYVVSQSATDLSFYSIYVDNLVVGDSTVDAGLQIIVDSGANAFEVPDDTADMINSYWSAVNDDGTLDCSATLTVPIGVTIGGTTYYIDPVDLIYEDPETGACYTLVGTTTANYYSISDPLLKNVVAVYDWEDEVLAFYPRPIYES